MQLKMSDKIYKTMLFRNQKAITAKLWSLKEDKQTTLAYMAPAYCLEEFPHQSERMAMQVEHNDLPE